MTIPTIKTQHLILRPWRLEDADSLFLILQEPNILAYFPPTTFTIEKTQHYINHQLNHWREHGYGHWAVALKTDNRLIGWDGLEYLPETDENEVAYMLSHQVWSRGYATEAAGAALRFGFRVVGLKVIIGLVHPENAASIRVLEKSGLTFLDRKVYWGLEMLRYQIGSNKELPADNQSSISV